MMQSLPLEISGFSSKEYERIVETIKTAEKAKRNYLQGGGQNENYKICQPLWHSKCSKTIQ